MKKAAKAILEATPKPERPRGQVPLTWPEAYRRAQQALLPTGRTCYAVEGPRRVPWETGTITLFDIELRDRGTVREIPAPECEHYFRDLGVVDEVDRPFGYPFE